MKLRMHYFKTPYVDIDYDRADELKAAQTAFQNIIC